MPQQHNPHSDCAISLGRQQETALHCVLALSSFRKAASLHPFQQDLPKKHDPVSSELLQSILRCLFPEQPEEMSQASQQDAHPAVPHEAELRVTVLVTLVTP